MSQNSELLDILKSEQGMASVPSKSAKTKIRARKNTEQAAVPTSTPRSRGNYAMARLVVNILTVFGLITIGLGVLIGIVGVFQGMASSFVGYAGALSGVYLAVAGIFQLGFAQLILAIVNTAIDTRATRDILEARL